MVEQWNNLTVADGDTEFLDFYNSVISYVSIKIDEDNKKTDDK